MNYLVSVIVPIYNTEQYLEECLKSIANQTYKNLEIILINDGSTDNSEKICFQFLNQDNRIIYSKQKNGGISNARNNGVQLATGSYILFVDSDDFIDTTTIEEGLHLIEKYKLDVLEFKSNRKEEKNEIEEGKLFFENKNQTVQRIIDKKIFFVWNKIISSSLAKQISFVEKQIYEDILYPLNLIEISKKYAFYNKVFYHYNTLNLSLTRNKYSLIQLDQIKSYEQAINFLDKNNFNESIIMKYNNLLAFFYMKNFLNLSISSLDTNYRIRNEIKQKLKKLNHTNRIVGIKIINYLPPLFSALFFKFRNTFSK